MESLRFATQSLDQLRAEFGTDPDSGLSAAEAEQRLRAHGPNAIEGKETRWWHILGRQFRSAFIYLLLVAAVIVFAIGETLDGGIILLFVGLNAALGFYQEYKSEQSLRALQRYIVSRCSVKRGAAWHTVDTRILVPGDVVRMETGDTVPADIRIFEESSIRIDETTLTGESAPVSKRTAPLSDMPKDIYGAENICFSGTAVVGGEAEGIVVATGNKTAIGGIARLTVETTKESAFSRGISRFSLFILRLIIITLVVVFVANLAIKGADAPVLELIVFSIALTVSVIPEALPVVSSVSLSRGALQLARRHVVVKRLTSIEDVGSIDILCSDKTGTLTENVLTVSGLSPDAAADTLRYAAIASTESAEKTEPFDIAVQQASRKEASKESAASERIAELPFDPLRRRNSVLVRSGKQVELVVRGAPEELLRLSDIQTKEKRTALEKWMNARSAAGERLLAVARKDMPHTASALEPQDEQGLTFLGIIAFTDPVKPSTLRAVKKAEKLGVGIKVITGDNPLVAGAVAKEIGLISDARDVMTGSAFMALPPEERTRAAETYAVFARVVPEEKYEIIKTLQEHHEVGFLGEGINDAPALKLASVSLVVESAANIAREAADIILLQKNLEVIVDGIHHGRIVFANSIKYLKATLASNFGNFYAIALGSLFITFLPMLPLQILLVNLLSDFPMISIATDTVDRRELARPQKYHVHDIILIATILGVVSMVFDFLFFGFFVSQGEGILQTNWFIGSILTELVFLFSVRTRLPMFRAVRPSWLVLSLSAIAAAATIGIPYTGFGQGVFHFTPPSAVHMGIILGLVLVYLICSEIVKLLYYQRKRDAEA